MSDIKYPEVKVRLSGQNGNAFFILGRVSSEMKKAGVPAKEIDDFSKEATAGDYDHLLRTTMRWVDVL